MIKKGIIVDYLLDKGFGLIIKTIQTLSDLKKLWKNNMHKPKPPTH